MVKIESVLLFKMFTFLKVFLLPVLIVHISQQNTVAITWSGKRYKTSNTVEHLNLPPVRCWCWFFNAHQHLSPGKLRCFIRCFMPFPSRLLAQSMLCWDQEMSVMHVCLIPPPSFAVSAVRGDVWPPAAPRADPVLLWAPGQAGGGPRMGGRLRLQVRDRLRGLHPKDVPGRPRFRRHLLHRGRRRPPRLRRRGRRPRVSRRLAEEDGEGGAQLRGVVRGRG